MDREVKQIGNTPLSISVYSVESAPTRMNEPGIVEILLCLKGTVRFGYAYEDFTLRPGDYISVDRDAYYLYDGKDNLCVSFYLDTNQYNDKYPYADHALFVCEGTEETDFPEYPTRAHVQIKGLMISALKCIMNGAEEEQIQQITDNMVDLFFEQFDIIFYHYGSQDMPEKAYRRMRKVHEYLYQNMTGNVELEKLAGELAVSKSYLSEFTRKHSIGFRGILGYMRANRSEWYLMNTDKTIVEISEECGFSDVKYYYNAFKRWYKSTPRQFRERYCKITDAKITYYPLAEAEKLVDDLIRSHYLEIFTEIKEISY